jgi:hypothetical protein
MYVLSPSSLSPPPPPFLPHEVNFELRKTRQISKLRIEIEVMQHFEKRLFSAQKGKTSKLLLFIIVFSQ